MLGATVWLGGLSVVCAYKVFKQVHDKTAQMVHEIVLGLAFPK